MAEPAQFFVNVVDRGADLQAAIDAPFFQSNHAPDSFFPRRAQPNRLLVETRMHPAVLDELAGLCAPVGFDFRWRPQAADPNDDLVLETAVNGGASVIASLS